MVKNFTKHGNSWALVIDKPILDLLNIDPAEDAVEITTDGRSIIAAPAHAPDRREKLRKAISEIHEEFGDVMKRLAE